MSRLMMILIAVLLVIAGGLWLRHENGNLTRSLEKANRVASEQKTLAGMLKNQLRVATDRADKNELAQVDMRRKLDAATQREAEREKTIKRLLNENDEFRRWYGALLPDAVRRLHHRAACADAGDCLQRLPESEPVPDAGK
ncbi:TPA: LysB family phage lysis regulatory protein [Kluyvera intermedia]|uniref:Protein lysB n=2 Tax=Enterobacteriaceae TaxID=543 RepID=A0AAC8QL41_9ENTR|nr:Rz-like lysis system protein LysB [Phytobacter ursingii]HAT2207373.1 LysB family phage lysis regulatory protein [Kluyvera intermedia]AKL10781.1 protein lysB [Phytobacter ursingii]HAT2518653.1 LysB family phage lysis regulatory protein [Kluyvera intermedia]HAT2605129.1 LysB family phage lysis regulatory protein [Kluyvera intermedia]HAT2682029.1 LysB family phage lysis regulatory protein [Kluyvera intermedia]